MYMETREERHLEVELKGDYSQNIIASRHHRTKKSLIEGNTWVSSLAKNKKHSWVSRIKYMLRMKNQFLKIWKQNIWEY